MSASPLTLPASSASSRPRTVSGSTARSSALTVPPACKAFTQRINTLYSKHAWECKHSWEFGYERCGNLAQDLWMIAANVDGEDVLRLPRSSAERWQVQMKLSPYNPLFLSCSPCQPSSLYPTLCVIEYSCRAPLPMHTAASISLASARCLQHQRFGKIHDIDITCI